MRLEKGNHNTLIAYALLRHGEEYTEEKRAKALAYARKHHCTLVERWASFADGSQYFVGSERAQDLQDAQCCQTNCTTGDALVAFDAIGGVLEVWCVSHAKLWREKIRNNVAEPKLIRLRGVWAPPTKPLEHYTVEERIIDNSERAQ